MVLAGLEYKEDVEEVAEGVGDDKGDSVAVGGAGGANALGDLRAESPRSFTRMSS